MKAIFNGRCSACQAAILKGQEILTTKIGERRFWVHDTCLSKAEPPKAEPPKAEPPKVKKPPKVKPVELPKDDNTHRHPRFADIVAHLSLGEHVYLVGPRGSGKSTLAREIAKFFGLPYAEIGLSGGVTEGAVFGRASGLNDNYLDSDIVQKWENGGLVCLDEIDRADSNVLCSLNGGLASDKFWLTKRIGKTECVKHPTTRVVATANTVGGGADRQHVGANQLDGATLDRFTIITVDYDTDLEKLLCPDAELLNRLWTYRRNIAAARLERCIGTRQIAKAYQWKNKLGKDQGYIDGILFAGWRADEIAKTTSGV